MYDIIIIGGGPGGCTLARLLGNKYKILLVDKKEYTSDGLRVSQKCCGGLVDPDAQAMLAKFGLGLPKSVLQSPQLFAVRTIDIDNSIEKYYQRYYINIDRAQFDKWLQQIIPPSVEVLNNAIFKSFEELNNEILVKYHFNGKEYTKKAKLLVGADGAFSRVRKQAFSNRENPKLYISMQEWFKVGSSLNYYSAIFDKEITDFYCWTIPKEDYLILGAALNIDGNVHKKFSRLKEKLIKYGYSFLNPIHRNGAFIARPIATNQICIGERNIALIGEAAGFISPSSAEGLSYAFKSAAALAKALENGIDGYRKPFYDAVRPLVRNIIVKNIKAPAMYNKFIRRVIMGTGLMSIDVEK